MRDFYRDKKVLITGHTGFKGTWLCEILYELGAQVVGYALEPPTSPSLFALTHMQERVESVIGDVRDLEKMLAVFEKVQPQIVIHMAAQPLVRESYDDPVGTYATNVMGTVNVLECVRQITSVKSVVNVTTDKVYRNNEWEKGYVETDYLGGYDPYSNSKACSELVTHSYVQAFLKNQGIAVSTCRAGNVIGGGDFAKDRIIPDCIRAVAEGREIIVRNPDSTRPYQHVLEPLFAYLMIAKAQYGDGRFAGSYNVGPEEESCISTGALVDLFCEKWNALAGREDQTSWVNKSDGGPHEANFLKLDCTKIKDTFQWKPKWTVEQAIENVVKCEMQRLNGDNIESCMKMQIENYIG